MAAVEWLLKPGTRVTLNARKIRGCYLPMQVSFKDKVKSMSPPFKLLQATAVWLSTSQKAPEARAYKSAELVSELSLAVHDFILLRTGDIR